MSLNVPHHDRINLSFDDSPDAVSYLLFYSRYEMQQRGLLPAEEVGVVPDIYTKNYQMTHDLKNLRREMNKYKEAAL